MLQISCIKKPEFNNRKNKIQQSKIVSYSPISNVLNINIWTNIFFLIHTMLQIIRTHYVGSIVISRSSVWRERERDIYIIFFILPPLGSHISICIYTYMLLSASQHHHEEPWGHTSWNLKRAIPHLLSLPNSENPSLFPFSSLYITRKTPSILCSEGSFHLISFTKKSDTL